jgi:hypothetical protein
MRHQKEREKTSVTNAEWRIRVLQSLIDAHCMTPARGEEWRVLLADYLERQNAARADLGRMVQTA